MLVCHNKGALVLVHISISYINTVLNVVIKTSKLHNQKLSFLEFLAGNAKSINYHSFFISYLPVIN